MDRQQFIAAAKRPTRTLTFPGIGEVTVQALTLSQRLAASERHKADGPENTARTVAWYAACGLGWDDDAVDDLLDLDGDVVQTIYETVIELSGLAEDAVADAKNG